MRSFTISSLAALLITTMFTSVVNAQEVNLGPFSGTLSTTVSQGFQIRTEENDCKLVAGSATLSSTYTAAKQGLIGGSTSTGNGGCDATMTSSLGTSSKVVGIGSSNSDDGRVNFDKGDFTDVSSSLSLSFSGSSADGVGINISASGLRNSVLDVNKPTFKEFSNKAKDHLETNVKFGNAYVSLPVGDADITLGRYVQSQGVSALIPIGVNVVNPVSLPILRAPGTLLKDALLPQAMVGFNAYLGEGISMEAYYQLEQAEFELDAAGSFFGSELLGVGSGNNGILNSPNPFERGSPAFGNYYNIASCAARFKDQGMGWSATLGGGGNKLACTSADEFANIGTGTTDGGTATYLYHTTVSTSNPALITATNLSGTVWEGIADASAAAGGSATNIAAGMGAWATAGIGGAIAAANADITSIEGATYSASLFGGGVHTGTITDAQMLTAYRTLAAHGTSYGYGTLYGTVDIKRAPDALAKEEGQFGINLSGYADDIGTGVEWGLYYNNSHSNAPRVRMLSITNGYAPHLYGQYLQQTTAALGGSFNLESNTANNVAGTGGIVTLLETAVGSVAFGPTLCAALITGMTTGNFVNSTHLHDPDLCYNIVRGMNPLTGADSGTNNVAKFVGGAVGAMATLGYTNAARYQAYYPEDIQTFGGSLSTNIGSTTMNIEVAYRPDYPFQIDVADLVNNQLDSSGGSLVQSATIVAGVAAVSEALTAALASRATDQRWSAAPLCDLSSSGNASVEMAGYNYCDGTAEFDAWTLNTNFISFLSPSSPFVQEMGADSGSMLLDLGAVYIPGLNYNQGVVAANHFYAGHDVWQNGCNDSTGTSNALTFYKNALFGTNYCDDDKSAGADTLAVQAKFRGSLTYNNFNNSQWSFSPSFAWDHGIHGNAPSSLGGWTEKSYQLGLGASFSNPSGMNVSLNYTNRLGKNMQNKSTDKDTLSASVSYSF